MVVISSDETECLWCSFLKARSCSRFVGTNSQSCRMSASLFWRLVYLAEWGLSLVSADKTYTQQTHQDRVVFRNAVFAPSIDMPLPYSLRCKVSHLTGFARPGCVCGLAHSFRSSSVDGDHEDTRNCCSRCVQWCGKHKRARLFLRSVSVSLVFFLWVECPCQRSRIGFCWASLVNWTKRRNHTGKGAFCVHSLGWNLKFRRVTWQCVM